MDEFKRALDGVMPCPFCGAKQPDLAIGQIHGPYWAVHCLKCDAKGPPGTFAEQGDLPTPLAMWNSRARTSDG